MAHPPGAGHVYVLEGTLTFQSKSKTSRVVKVGQAVAEDLNTRMRVVNYGDEPAKTVVFQISEPNAAFRQKEKTNRYVSLAQAVRTMWKKIRYFRETGWVLRFAVWLHALE